jgi:Phosphotransferase enzyme family
VDNDWLDPAWRQSAHTWIADRHAELGLRPSGPVEEVRVRPWSAVLRAPTDAGWTWFKANTYAARYEAPLVAYLVHCAPKAIVTPLAVDTDRGWLLSPDHGPTMREAEPAPVLDRWEAMVGAYAELQREVADRADDLVRLGTPDLRPERMPGELAALLDDRETRDHLGAERLTLILGLRRRYADWCAELANDGIPASIQHDDLHDNNVFADGTGFRFFDWADSSVAHPFGSLLVGLRNAAARFDWSPDAPELHRLRDAYLEPWTGDHDRGRLRRSAALAMRVANVSRALSWRRALSDAALPVPEEWRSAPADWLAELAEPD